MGDSYCSSQAIVSVSNCSRSSVYTYASCIRVKGSRENVPLKSVPRKQILTVFVGRLHSDTTEEELTKYLTDEGIKGVVCRKIVAKNGCKYNSAAFRVTCCSESRDKFYDENCRPIVG